MTRPRTAPLVLAIVSLAVVAVSSFLMARRIADYNVEKGREIFAFMEVYEPTFSYAGREVSITQTEPAAEGRTGTVDVRYGEDTLSLPITVPLPSYADQIPGLRRYEDWFKIIRFASLTGRSMTDLRDAIDRGEEADRLVLVARNIRPGVNPETWGEVFRKDWVFEFHEFRADGGFTTERYAYPTRRSVHGETATDTPGGLPELDSRTWQYQAADLLMPKGKAPRIMAGDSPLVAVGWTFPVAIGAVLVAIISLFAAFAPRGGWTQTDAADEAQASA